MYLTGTSTISGPEFLTETSGPSGRQVCPDWCTEMGIHLEDESGRYHSGPERIVDLSLEKPETCRAGDGSEVTFPAQMTIYLQQRDGQHDTRVALSRNGLAEVNLPLAEAQELAAALAEVLDGRRFLPAGEPGTRDVSIQRGRLPAASAAYPQPAPVLTLSPPALTIGGWATIVNIASERLTVKITFLGKDSTPNDSPTLFATDRDTLLVQGYKVTDPEALAAMRLPDNETVVEVPPALMKYLPPDVIKKYLSPEEPPDGDGEGHG